MGAEPARIVAAPRSALGGAAPKREAAASTPLPASPPRESREPRPYDRDRGGSGGQNRDQGEYGGPRPEDRGQESRPAPAANAQAPRPPRRDDRPPRRDDRPPRRDDRGPRPPSRGTSDVNATEAAEVQAARGSLAAERADLEAAEASPEALTAGKEILEELMRHIGFAVSVEVETGDTSRLNVVADPDGHEALGSLIGRKGERLSALQHLVNLMLSRRMGEWTRVPRAARRSSRSSPGPRAACLAPIGCPTSHGDEARRRPTVHEPPMTDLPSSAADRADNASTAEIETPAGDPELAALVRRDAR